MLHRPLMYNLVLIPHIILIFNLPLGLKALQEKVNMQLS